MRAALQSVLCGAHSYRQQIRALVELEAQKIQAIKVCILGRNGWGVWMGSMVESSVALNAQDMEVLTKMRDDALKDPLAFVQRLQEGVSGQPALRVMVQL